MTPRDIAIAGGGIGGLAAALGLLRLGHKVRVYEKADNPTESGAGLSIPPNAAAALSQLGLKKGLRATADLPEQGFVYSGRSGEQLSVTPYGDTLRTRFGDDYYQIPRADLYQLLASAIAEADPGCIRTGTRVSHIVEEKEHVTFSVNGKKTQEAALLIGADGLRSATREHVVGSRQARFTGYIAWRALIPMELLPDNYARNQSSVWVGPARTFVYYPLRQGTLLNCVMFAGDSTWEGESWRQKAEAGEVRDAFAPFDKSVQQVIEAIPESECYKWALMDRDPLSCWHTNRVVLLGDAAHPMLPFLGQGASMALEDAWTLAVALTQQNDLSTALSLYSLARTQRANWVLLESRAAGERFANPKPAASHFKNDQAMQTSKLFSWQPPRLSEPLTPEP